MSYYQTNPYPTITPKDQDQLPFYCREVYFSAWYNAQMNNKEKSLQGLPASPNDEIPAMLTKTAGPDSRKISAVAAPGAPTTAATAAAAVHAAITAKKNGAKVPILSHLAGGPTNTTTTSMLPGATPAKSMPIHCIVEQANSCRGDALLPGKHGDPTVEMDTYAILPSSTLFNEIIRVAMIKLGYSVVEAMGAKGAVQIKNWKPLTFDTITDYPDATVEEILGDLTSIATLRIRLCSRSKLNALEDVKEKLLQFLVQHSQGMLQSIGCPIEKGTLSRICKGDYPLNLPDDTRQAFEKWYKDQTMKREPLSEPRPAKEPRYDTSAPHVTSSYPTIRSELNMSVHGLNASPFTPKTRIRTSFDPEHEIPRLHRWFQQNQHPSREQMVMFLNELNGLESRRGRKPLDLTNIIYWFKNARAAQRRANRSSDVINEDQSMDVEDSMDDHDVEQEADRLSPVSTESVPILPNKNAVYVVSSPLHHHQQPSLHTTRCDSPIIEIIPQDPNDDSHTVETSVVENNNEKRRIVENGHHNNNNIEDQVMAVDGRENGHDYTRQRSESVDSHSSLEGAASDKGERSGSGRNSVDERDHERERPVEVKQEVEPMTRDADYPSSSTASSPSPQQRMMPLSTPQPPPAHQSHPLAMTPIHHPMNLHYMHPAAAHALYASLESSAMLSSPSPFKDSSPMSAEERKKRSRVFIDPLSEIPKLEKWFAEDTHPSSYMIEKYTEELNRSEYRQRFPKLEPKNVQLWFKNHRAKVKRGRLEQ